LLGSVARATVMPVAQAIVAVSFADGAGRRRAISRVQSGAPLAATLGVPCLTIIVAVLQWRAAFLVVSGLSLAVMLILAKILPRHAEKIAGQVRLKEILAAYAPLFERRATLILIVAACVENAGVNAMWTYYGAFYVQHYAFSAEWVGWVSLAAGLGVLVGQTAAGGRLGTCPSRLLILGCAGSGTLIGLPLMVPAPAMAAIAVMGAGWLMHGLVMVSTVVLLVARTPSSRGTALTLYGSAMNFGMALGALLGALALTWAGYFALGLCTLALPLAAGVLVSICCARIGPIESDVV
jgi:MFS transporter, DHA1 family, inner membrane transport protein